MRAGKREARMREIEAEAHKLFTTLGFENTSMLTIAKNAKASNETLYRWYGDKNGLFESMVRANAETVRKSLADASQAESSPMETLTQVARRLLKMLLSDEAIVLNRAAASDPTGALGYILAQAGREAVLPLVTEVLHDTVRAGDIGTPDEGDLGALFVRLLVGDQQIRRVIGALQVPDEADVAQQVDLAIHRMKKLCPGRLS